MVHPVVQDVAKPAGIRVVRMAVVLRGSGGRVPMSTRTMGVHGGRGRAGAVVGRVDMDDSRDVEQDPCQRQQTTRPTT